MEAHAQRNVISEPHDAPPGTFHTPHHVFRGCTWVTVLSCVLTLPGTSPELAAVPLPHSETKHLVTSLARVGGRRQPCSRYSLSGPRVGKCPLSRRPHTAKVKNWGSGQTCSALPPPKGTHPCLLMHEYAKNVSGKQLPVSSSSLCLYYRKTTSKENGWCILSLWGKLSTKHS